MVKFEKDEIGPLYIVKGYSVYESAGVPERKRGIRTSDTEEGPADEWASMCGAKEREKQMIARNRWDQVTDTWQGHLRWQRGGNMEQMSLFLAMFGTQWWQDSHEKMLEAEK